MILLSEAQLSAEAAVTVRERRLLTTVVGVGVDVHAFNPSPSEVQAGESGFQSHL